MVTEKKGDRINGPTGLSSPIIDNSSNGIKRLIESCQGNIFTAFNNHKIKNAKNKNENFSNSLIPALSRG